MAGDAETGVTIMRVEAGLDSGAVALAERTPIEPSDDYGTLSARLAELGGELIVRALDLRAAGRLEFTDQDDSLATYAEKISPAERRLDPARPAAELERTVRALNPHVGAYLELDGGQRLGRPGGLGRGRVAAGRAARRRWRRAAARVRRGSAAAGRRSAPREAPDGRRMPTCAATRRRGWRRDLGGGYDPVPVDPALERGRDDASAPGLPRLRRALAAPDPATGALPLRLLPAALRAGLGMPELRRAPDDRPHERLRGHALPALRRLHAEVDLIEAATESPASPELFAGRRVAPSILSADFSRLGAQIDEVMAAGARLIHVDVMDGHFVPPITIGPLVAGSIADQVHDAGGALDVHLMIERPAEPGVRVRARGRRLHQLPLRGRRSRPPHPRGDPRGRLPGRPGAEPGDAGRVGHGADRGRRPDSLHVRQPRLGRPAVHRLGAGQGLEAARPGARPR